jgi:hypothetical protein
MDKLPMPTDGEVLLGPNGPIMIWKICGTILEAMLGKDAKHERQGHKFAQRQTRPPEP